MNNDVELVSFCNRFKEAYRTWKMIIDLPWDDEETERLSRPFFEEYTAAYRKAFAIPATTKAGLLAKLHCMSLFSYDLKSMEVDFNRLDIDENMSTSVIHDTISIMEGQRS